MRTRFLIGVGLVAALLSLWPISKSTRFQFFGEAIARVETDMPAVALTLDDGPSRKHTAAVLELLEQKDAIATFFLTGRESAANPDMVRQIIAAGHALGNHSYNHDRLILKWPSTIGDDLARTDAVLREAGYDASLPFRPPYGQKLFALPWVLRSDNRPSIMWDVAPEPDAQSARELAEAVVTQARPGSIILLHVMYDSRAMSREALPLITDGLRERGFSLMTVDDLLALRVP